MSCAISSIRMVKCCPLVEVCLVPRPSLIWPTTPWKMKSNWISLFVTGAASTSCRMLKGRVTKKDDIMSTRNEGPHVSLCDVWCGNKWMWPEGFSIQLAPGKRATQIPMRLDLLISRSLSSTKHAVLQCVRAWVRTCVQAYGFANIESHRLDYCKRWDEVCRTAVHFARAIGPESHNNRHTQTHTRAHTHAHTHAHTQIAPPYLYSAACSGISFSIFATTESHRHCTASTFPLQACMNTTMDNKFQIELLFLLTNPQAPHASHLPFAGMQTRENARTWTTHLRHLCLWSDFSSKYAPVLLQLPISHLVHASSFPAAQHLFWGEAPAVPETTAPQKHAGHSSGAFKTGQHP